MKKALIVLMILLCIVALNTNVFATDDSNDTCSTSYTISFSERRLENLNKDDDQNNWFKIQIQLFLRGEI